MLDDPNKRGPQDRGRTSRQKTSRRIGGASRALGAEAVPVHYQQPLGPRTQRRETRRLARRVGSTGRPLGISSPFGLIDSPPAGRRRAGRGSLPHTNDASS